jgi:hypothetical protein
MLPCVALISALTQLRCHIEHVDEHMDARLKRIEKEMGE